MKKYISILAATAALTGCIAYTYYNKVHLTWPKSEPAQKTLEVIFKKHELTQYVPHGQTKDNWTRTVTYKMKGTSTIRRTSEKDQQEIAKNCDNVEKKTIDDNAEGITI